MAWFLLSSTLATRISVWVVENHFMLSRVLFLAILTKNLQNSSPSELAAYVIP